jgi:putative hydrolase of HD superfamily
MSEHTQPASSETFLQSNILELIKLLTDFQGVERGIKVPGTERPENDAEHSYNLAMAAWVIIEKDKLPLDLDKVLKRALVHDLPEVYAGDAFALDPAQVATKVEKETAALEILSNNELTSELAIVIKEYEALDDEESKFVYSLDKLMAALGVLYGQSSIWKDNGMTQQMWEEKFRAKIELSQYTKPYLDFVIKKQKESPHLFA